LDVAATLLQLKKRHPDLQKAVVKLNEGFSGDGNAVFQFPENITSTALSIEILLDLLPVQLSLVASDLDYNRFMRKMSVMGGIVEIFIEGQIKTSPSVQCIITPLGKCEIVSTHDQVLGGNGGQVYQGAHFPANAAYAGILGAQCLRVSEALKAKGVLGRVGIDFMSVKQGDQWQHYAIEINLRKGGTTHPLLMLTYLTDGHYNADKGEYKTATDQPRYYFCSDNLQDKKYEGLTPHDLIEIAMLNDLHFESTSQEGIMFHLIGALSEFGKLGVVCIGATPEKAMQYYQKICSVLEWECRND
jgi:hypothetical protein